MAKKTFRTYVVAYAILLLCAFSQGLDAAVPAGYPGATWGSVMRGFDGIEGTGAQGWVRQGARWFNIGNAGFNTYASYNWRVRTKNKTYYNTYGPGLSAAMELSPFSVGTEYTWLRYPELGDTNKNFVLFADWYGARDVSKWTGPLFGKHLPFSTWGRLTYDLHGFEGSGAQGWVRQGVEWFSLKGYAFTTYGAYNWRLRTKNKKYYDMQGPSLGAVLTRGAIGLGVEYLWQRFPELRRNENTFNAYLNWFFDWDLKGK